MQQNKNFLDYPIADEIYTAIDWTGGGSVLLRAGKKRLVFLYVFNRSASTVYMALMDSVDGLAVTSKVPYPIAPGGFISLTFAGGRRFETGIAVKFCSDVGLTTPTGSADFWIDAGMTAYA